MSDIDAKTNGDDDGVIVEVIDHGELFISRPYVGSALGATAAVVTGCILALAGTGLIACAVAVIAGALVGGIAGFVMLVASMSFSAEQAGYGRFGDAPEHGPSLGYRVVGWLFLPLPVILGIGATLLVAYILR
jgi:hypothetical protein